MSKTGGMPERKEVVSIHLVYEVTMFRLIYRRLKFEFDLQSTANLFIEGFALHARNLIDFFWDDLRANSKDSVARHFADKSYCPFDGVDPKTTGVYAKINKQISHITYDRTHLAENKLGLEDRKTLYEMIGKEIQNFTSHVRVPYKELLQRPTDVRTSIMPVLGADHILYEIGKSGPFTATVSTTPTVVTVVSFPADRADDGDLKSKM